VTALAGLTTIHMKFSMTV